MHSRRRGLVTTSRTTHDAVMVETTPASPASPCPAFFIQEFSIVLSGSDERRLNARFEAGRQAYNASLAEALRRWRLMSESRAFRRCRASGPVSGRAVASLRRSFGLNAFAMHGWARDNLNKTWIGEHLDAQAIRALSDRATRGVDEYGTALRGRPRFKSANRFQSLEGKSNSQGIRLRGRRLKWRGLDMALRMPDEPRVKHALSSPIKRIRIVRRRIAGRQRFFAQLVCAGRPLQDERLTLGSGVVGLDPGPRVFGIATPVGHAALVDLGGPSAAFMREQRRLQRSIERKRRHQRSIRAVRVSASVQRDRNRLSELRRKDARHRRTRIGALANALIGLGSQFHVERNSYFSFQRNFGRSVSSAAPAKFVGILARKAANAGGQVYELPVTLRLSQICHGCGIVLKKPLALRTHVCECGVGPVQRDLYSAWLATMATFDPSGSVWRLDVDRASKAWSGAGHRLPATSRPFSIEEFVFLVRAQAASADTGSPSDGTERLAGAAGAKRDEARDVVGSLPRARESLAGRGQRGAWAEATQSREASASRPHSRST